MRHYNSAGIINWPLPAQGLEFWAEALKKRAKNYRRKLKRCRQGFSRTAVHDSRIDARRLIAQLELLNDFVDSKHARIVRGILKKHLDILDELRDAQVQLATMAQFCGQLAGANVFRGYLSAREKRCLQQAGKDRGLLKSRRLMKYLSQCRKELKEAAGRFSAIQVNRRLRLALEAAFQRVVRRKELVVPSDTFMVHRTRIAFKTFRYMVESPGKDLLKREGSLVGGMQRYQRIMGAVQDAEVLGKSLEKFLRKHPLNAAEAKALRRACERQRQRRMHVYLRHAGELLNFRPHHGRAAPL